MPVHPLARNSTYKRLQEVQGGTVTRGMSVGSRYPGHMNQVSYQILTETYRYMVLNTHRGKPFEKILVESKKKKREREIEKGEWER